MFYDTSQQLMSLIPSANDAVCSNEVGHFSFRFLFPIFSSLDRQNKGLLSVLVLQ